MLLNIEIPDDRFVSLCSVFIILMITGLTILMKIKEYQYKFFCIFPPINKKKYSIETGATIRYSNLIFRKNEYYSFHKIRPNTESSILFGDQLFERTNSSNYSFELWTVQVDQTI